MYFCLFFIVLRSIGLDMALSNISPVRNMKRVQPRSLLVLGNGKSLADYPFDKYNVDTIGMSQAFRYWRKIKWYPTYYVCLDRNINRTFAKDIKALVKNRNNNGIKRFFLSKEILHKYPKFGKMKCVNFVETLNQSGNRGFSGDTQVTSGSYAVRFGLWLGYKRIYMLGIDSKYTPVDIKWIQKVTDSNQRLKIDIKPDPDYFFDDYRKKGDYLHIPPKRRWKSRDNHLQTFQKINKEFNRGSVKKVINCNKASQLFKRSVLPYEPIPECWTAWMVEQEVKDEIEEIVVNGEDIVVEDGDDECMESGDDGVDGEIVDLDDDNRED